MAQHFAWENTEARFDARIMVSMRFSHLQGELKEFLDGDLRDMKRAIQYACEQRTSTWHPFVTSEEIPVPRALRDASVSERARARQLVLDKNRVAADHSDCLIIHSWENGSTMVGDIQRSFIEGPIVRPVVVARYSSGPGVSLAWEALADEHPQVQFVDFDRDNLIERLKDCLEGLASTIEESAVARRALEDQWRPVCGAVSRALANETPSDREQFARRLGRTPRSLHRLVNSPMQMAALPDQKANRIRTRYGEQIRTAILAEVVNDHFGARELEAWKQWASGQPRARALRVLELELKEREAAGVYKSRPQRPTTESWELLAGAFNV